MKTKTPKRIMALLVAIIMLIVSAQSTLAITNDSMYSAEFEPGSVIVSLKSGAPSVTSLLNGFSIEESRLITPGSDTQNVYLVRFTEKTKEIVWRAIEVLNKSPYVIAAEPDYYQGIDDEIEEIITEAPTQQTTQTTNPTIEPTEKNDDSDEFEPGAVIVSLKFGAPSVTSLLNGFSIEESRLITPGSDTQNVYLVRFTEKTKEIVWRAIEVLNKSPYVIAAEPDYYQGIDDEIEEIITEAPTQQTTQTTNPTIEPTEKNDDSDEFEPGAVIVSLKFGAPSVTSLLNGFSIEESRLITPGSDTQNVYLVRFTEKTKEIVWRAIEVLNKSPYVIAAEPDYHQYVDDDIEEIVTDQPTQPTSSETEAPSIGLAKGDADGDGYVSITDATTIQRYLVGFYDLDDEQLLAADTDGDGYVLITDVTVIQRYLVGLVENW